MAKDSERIDFGQTTRWHIPMSPGETRWYIPMSPGETRWYIPMAPGERQYIPMSPGETHWHTPMKTGEAYSRSYTPQSEEETKAMPSIYPTSEETLELAVLFDQKDLGAFCEGSAWSLFMRSIDATCLCKCHLFSGYVGAPKPNSSTSFGIGVLAPNANISQYFRRMLSHIIRKGFLPPERRFLGNFRRYDTLKRKGFIDRWGRFILEDIDSTWLFYIAKKSGWRYLPSERLVQYLKDEFHMRTRPGVLLPWHFKRVVEGALAQAGVNLDIAKL